MLTLSPSDRLKAEVSGQVVRNYLPLLVKR